MHDGREKTAFNIDLFCFQPLVDDWHCLKNRKINN